MGAREPGQVPRFAVLSPYFASWLLRYVGVDPGAVRETAERLQRNGRPDLVAQLVDGVAQIRASADWHRARVAANVAAEPAITEPAPTLVLVTSAVAAELLGISPSMVRRLCREEHLAARHTGRPWLIERRSIADLLEARRSAA